MDLYKVLKTKFPRLLTWLFGVHIHGSENEPLDGGYIAICNHISFVDVFIMALAVKKKIRFMAKKELFSVPVIGKLVDNMGAFPVDRKGSAVAPIKKSIALLEAGEAVGMFPQGHRFPKRKFDTTKAEIKGGAAMACYRAKATVLPMFIATKNDKITLFKRTDIYVGKPIAFEEFGFTKGGSEEYEKAAEMMFERIAELAPEERRSK